jgi:hypothetical protein
VGHVLESVGDTCPGVRFTNCPASREPSAAWPIEYKATAQDLKRPAGHPKAGRHSSSGLWLSVCGHWSVS